MLSLALKSDRFNMAITCMEGLFGIHSLIQTIEWIVYGTILPYSGSILPYSESLCQTIKWIVYMLPLFAVF